jgi:hypothetical protein
MNFINLKNNFFKKINYFNKNMLCLEEEINNGGLNDKIQGLLNKNIINIKKACEKIKRGKFASSNLKELKSILRELTFDWFLKSACIKRSFEKPRGYAGDFEIIDRIYRNEPTGKGIGFAIDKYYLENKGCKAMRSRKKFCVNLIIKLVKEIFNKNQQLISIFNLGGGPGRDILEILEQLNYSVPVNIKMLDQDEEALKYSKNILKKFLNYLNFKNVNLLRIVAGERYNVDRYGQHDIILCIGLYDYLDEEAAVKLTRSIYPMLKKSGKIIISNWDISNPSQTEMEWICDWYVYYRTKGSMLRIFKKAQIPSRNIKLMKDPSGYFHIGILEKN